MKIASSPYLRPESSDFDEVWYADVDLNSQDGFLTKIEILQIQDGGRSPYWKSYFGYISAPYWPIKAKFGVEMKNHMRHVTRTAISQIQDGGRLPFWI